MTPTVGRIVHYVMPDGSPRAAIVVRVCSKDTVNLAVFHDGGNDLPFNSANGLLVPQHPFPFALLTWQTSVCFDAGQAPQPRTWHWPERE